MSLATNKHHLALGRAIDAWSEAEGWIFYIFRLLIRTNLDVAYTIMASFLGFRGQIELFQRIVKLQPMEAPLRKLLLDACKEFELLTPQRNKIIHGEWITHGLPHKWKTVRVGKTKSLRYFDAYNQTGQDAQNAVFTIKTINRFTSDCRKLSARMSKIASNPLLEKRFPHVW